MKIITVKGQDRLLGNVIVTTGASRALKGQAAIARMLLAAHARMIEVGLTRPSRPGRYRSGIDEFTVDTDGGSTILMHDSEAHFFCPASCYLRNLELYLFRQQQI